MKEAGWLMIGAGIGLMLSTAAHPVAYLSVQGIGSTLLIFGGIAVVVAGVIIRAHRESTATSQERKD